MFILSSKIDSSVIILFFSIFYQRENLIFLFMFIISSKFHKDFLFFLLHLYNLLNLLFLLLLFSSLKFDFDRALEYDGELIFIPKPIQKESYIPSLFLINEVKKISENFLIFFHGNGEDIFGARNICEKLKEKLKMNTLIVEYQSYSIYNYETNSNKILENNLIVFDFLIEKLKDYQEIIFIFGKSIRSSPLIYLSNERKQGALFYVSGFTSIKEAAIEV